MSISDITISGTFHVDKGETIRLHCNATGAATPPDAVDWFKDGIKIHSDSIRPIYITKQFTISKKTITSELLIKSADLSDTGTYTCRTSDLQVTSESVNVLNGKYLSRRMKNGFRGFRPGPAQTDLYRSLKACIKEENGLS